MDQDDKLVAWGPVGFYDVADTPKTLADQAQQLIREDINSGRLSPGGKVVAEELKERYGLGLSPIREALIRSAAVGLLRLQGLRGFSVPPLLAEELEDIANVRAELECLALRRSIELGDDKWEAGIVAAFYRLERLVPVMLKNPDSSIGQWEERNREFHAALGAAYPSRWFKYLTEITFIQTERYRRHVYPSVIVNISIQTLHNEHAKIMRAALDRSADLACKLLTQHIAQATERSRPFLQSLSAPARAQTKGKRTKVAKNDKRIKKSKSQK